MWSLVSRAERWAWPLELPLQHQVLCHGDVYIVRGENHRFITFWEEQVYRLHLVISLHLVVSEYHSK